MRLDEAIGAFLDGKAVEFIDDGDSFVFGRYGNNIGLSKDGNNVTIPGWPVNGYRLKREVLNPMQAWSRMKAGKVVRSEACLREFRYFVGALEIKVVGGNGFIPAYDSMDKFMSATDLYEVEAE